LIMGHSPLSSMINELLSFQVGLIMGHSPLSSMIIGLLSLQVV
jgi:hypothetical protein